MEKIELSDIKHGNGGRLGWVNLYFGRRGGGKTQQAAIDAYEAHLQGKIVVSNIWLSFPHIRYRKIKELPPILTEIFEYANEVKMPTEAPIQMLKEYGLKRRKGEVKEFFLLIDEAGTNLDSRSWAKNFKDEYMQEMLTEPRKCGMTIVGITQEWDTIDKRFRGACEDWFLFSKTGKWMFERMRCTHLWVMNGEFNFDKPMIIETHQKWVYWDKRLNFFRTLYWTGELNGVGSREDVPHSFKKGSIYSKKPRDILPLIKPVSENEGSESGTNKGENPEDSGASPT